MDIKTTTDIWNMEGYRKYLHKKKGREHKWVDIDDLIERIETICNHGNERDMRFRNHLIKSLSIGFVILTKEGERIWKGYKIPFLTKLEARAELKDLRKHNYKEMIGAKVIPLEEISNY